MKECPYLDVLIAKKLMIDQHINEIIAPYRELIGHEFEAYHNHVHRVGILAMKLKRKEEEEDALKIAIAAVHHDIGIWTAKTFDYLVPSIDRAHYYLKENGLEEWSEEIRLIIDMHHKRSVYKGDYADNVEAFRRADLVDLMKGRIRFGLSAEMIKNNYQKYPILGFRSLIVKRFFKNLLSNPLNPLPMMKK